MNVGAYYQFQCSGCKYTAEVSGGEDCGFKTRTRTMICPDCKALVDVITGGTGVVDAQDLIDKCPNCKSAGVLPWDSGQQPCPKCGKRMKKGSLVALWD